LKHWSGTRAELAKNLVSGCGAVSGCEKIGWSGSGKSRSGEWSTERGAGVTEINTGRFEREAKILLLALCSCSDFKQSPQNDIMLCPMKPRFGEADSDEAAERARM